MSKGSASRPFSVPKAAFDASMDRIFGKRERAQYVPPPLCCNQNCDQGRNCPARMETHHDPDASAPAADQKDVQPAHLVAETGAAQRD